jgi:hypothetical protein
MHTTIKTRFDFWESFGNRIAIDLAKTWQLARSLN